MKFEWYWVEKLNVDTPAHKQIIGVNGCAILSKSKGWIFVYCKHLAKMMIIKRDLFLGDLQFYEKRCVIMHVF